MQTSLVRWWLGKIERVDKFFVAKAHADWMVWVTSPSTAGLAKLYAYRVPELGFRRIGLRT